MKKREILKLIKDICEEVLLENTKCYDEWLAASRSGRIELAEEILSIINHE